MEEMGGATPEDCITCVAEPAEGGGASSGGGGRTGSMTPAISGVVDQGRHPHESVMGDRGCRRPHISSNSRVCCGL